MPSARHPTLATLHAWTGVLLALPLLVIALSGVLLVYRDALLVPADWRQPPPAAAALDVEAARLLALPDLRDAESIQLARGGRAFHVVTRRDGAREYWRSGADGAVAAPPWRLDLEPSLLELHEHLLLGESGDVLVRIVGPVTTALLVVGLVLWWPLRRGWRHRDLVVRGHGRPQRLRAHLALGGAAGLLFLVHAGSGALIANNPAIRDWLKPLVDPRASQWPGGESPGFAPGDAAAGLRALRRVFPSGEITQLAPTGAPADERWSLKLRLPGEAHPNGRSSITLDLRQGRVAALRDARRAGVPGTYDDLLFPLHTGVLFGPVQQLLWLCGGLGLARLALLGVAAWSARRRGPPRP